MAKYTFPRASDSLPATGQPRIAAPITDSINNILNGLEGKNLKGGNVNTSDTDGIVTMDLAQTISGLKTFTATNVHSGGIDLSGGKIDLDADNDTSIQVSTDDTVNLEIGTVNFEITDSPFATTDGLAFSNAAAATAMEMVLFAEDGDGTDNVYFKIMGLGTNASITNYEGLWLGWSQADSEYLITTETGGSGTARPINLRTGSGNDNQVYLATDANVGINTATFGSSAAGVLAIANGTQGAAASDMIQLVSEDLSAGNTQLSIRAEGTGSVGSGTPTQDTTIAIKYNGTQYYLLASTSAS